MPPCPARTLALCTLLALAGACAAERPTHAQAKPSSAPQTPARYSAPDAQGFGQAGDLVYFEEIAGSAKASDPLPMVVLIHGRGDRPQPGWLQPEPPTAVRIIMPEAPLRFGDGFSWTDARVSDTTGAGAEALARDLSQRADQIASAVEILKTQRPTRGTPIAAGFSQGGMLSYALAARHPHAFGALMPISGLLPKVLFPSVAPAPPRPPVLALHGTADPVVPIEGARAVVNGLAQKGYKVELREFEGVPHRITPEMRAAFNAWLATSLPR